MNTERLGCALVIAFIVGLFYAWVAVIAWEIRNPTANETQRLVHIVELLTFQKLDKFQGNSH